MGPSALPLPTGSHCLVIGRARAVVTPSGSDTASRFSHRDFKHPDWMSSGTIPFCIPALMTSLRSMSQGRSGNVAQGLFSRS